VVTSLSNQIADDVVLGAGATIGHYVVLGCDGPEEPLRIGDSCVVRSQSVIYRATVIGDDFHAGHGVLVRENTEIGDRVSIGSHSVVEHHVRIGSDVRLHSGCFVPEFSVLAQGCWLGPGVIVTNARYPNRPDTKDNLEGVTVGERAVIGAGAVLLPGIEIGADALIGAGAVVVNDVGPGVTVVGNPERALVR
jgi:acetyltransferase-like isoleucine patch superfamily enzyme